MNKRTTINSILGVFFFIAVIIFIVTPIISIKIKSCEVWLNILSAINTFAISYIVAYGVYYLTVERTNKYHQKEQKCIKKDLLLKIRHMIINISEDLNVDKDLSVETLQNTLQGIKEGEWESAILTGEKTCELTLKLFASGLTFSKDEFAVLYDVYQTVSSLLEYGYESRDKEIVIAIILQMQKISNGIDAICAEIDAD